MSSISESKKRKKETTPFESMLLSLMIVDIAFVFGQRKEMLEKYYRRQKEEQELHDYDKSDKDVYSVYDSDLHTRQKYYEYHYKHHKENRLGLSHDQNYWVLNSIWGRMTDEERKGLPLPPRYKTENNTQLVLNV